MADRVASGEYLRPEHDEEPGNNPRSVFWAKVRQVAPEMATSLYDDVLPLFEAYRERGGPITDLTTLRDSADSLRRLRPRRDLDGVEWAEEDAVLAEEGGLAGIVEAADHILIVSRADLEWMRDLTTLAEALEEWARPYGLSEEKWALHTVLETLWMWSHGPDDETFEKIRATRGFVLDGPRKRANSDEILQSYIVRVLEWKTTEETRQVAEGRALSEATKAVRDAFDRMESEADQRLTKALDAGLRKSKRGDDPWRHIEIFVRARVQGIGVSVLERSYDIDRRTVQKALAEPPRDCRRLQLLRGWSHDQGNEVLPGGAGAGGSDGVRARARI